jgi:hypothetical protein
MQIEATDEAGESYAFSGEAIALSPIMMWPNIAAFDSVFRWRDTCGRVAFSTVQTMHGQAYANALKTRRAATSELLR